MKTALIAVGVIIGFWLLTKTINSVGSDAGAVAYQQHCASCHGEKGEGFGELLPPLKDTDWLEENFDLVPCIIMQGLSDTITVNGVVYTEEMLPLSHLTDIEVYNIMNYLSKKFTKSKTYYSLSEVEAMYDYCK